MYKIISPFARPALQTRAGGGENRAGPAVGRQQEAAEGDRGQHPGDAAVVRGEHPGGRERHPDPRLGQAHVQRDLQEATGHTHQWSSPPPRERERERDRDGERERTHLIPTPYGHYTTHSIHV